VKQSGGALERTGETKSSFCPSTNPSVVRSTKSKPQRKDYCCRQPKSQCINENGNQRPFGCLPSRPVNGVASVSKSCDLVHVKTVPMTRVCVKKEYDQTNGQKKQADDETDCFHWVLVVVNRQWSKTASKNGTVEHGRLSTNRPVPGWIAW